MGRSVLESSNIRLKKHIDSEQGFIIISAHLLDITEDIEVKRAMELCQQLYSFKLGYIPLRATYIKTNNNQELYEHCFFVHKSQRNDFKQIALELCKTFKQECVLFVENKNAYGLSKNGDTALLGDCLGTIEEINQYWSKLKEKQQEHKHIKFESLYPISNFALNGAHIWGELFLHM